MRLPDGSILMHAGQPYDPKKAHDYYEKHKHLKGRKKGVTDILAKSGNRVLTANNPKLQKQKADVAARVGVLQKKLALLQTELKKRMSEAKKAGREAKKPDTAAEKSGKARDAKKYRDKNKQKLKNQAKKSGGSSKGSSPKKPKGTTAELKNTIDRVKKNLDAAIAQQRALG